MDGCLRRIYDTNSQIQLVFLLDSLKMDISLRATAVVLKEIFSCCVENKGL